MARISSLHRSILCMSNDELHKLFYDIRANRRTRPEAKKATPAKVKRRQATKRAPKQSDLFALAARMAPEDKAAMLAEVLKLK